MGTLAAEISSDNVCRIKRVLLVIRWPVGGIRTFVRYVYRDFDPREWHFTIVGPDMPEMRVLLEDLSGLSLEYKHVPEQPSSLCFAKSVARLIFKEKYDLVHSHGFTSGMCATVPSHLRGIPHLLTSHDVFNAKQFSGVMGMIKRIGMNALFCVIDKIHSVSYDAEENLNQFFPGLKRRAGKSVVIPNGIEIGRFLEAESRDFRGELGLGEEVFLIGFMGRFMAQKGFRYLVEAMSILKEMEGLPKRPLVLTFGDGGYIRREKQMIIERGLDGYFQFLAFTPNVAGTIKGLDVVAIPSLWEACPLLPMEALVCGAPVIGSDCIGLREVLEGTPATVVPKADANSLAHALAQEMKKNSKDLFLKHREIASKSFDVRETTKSILEIYKQMAI